MNTKEMNSIYAEFLALPYSLVLFLIEIHRITRGLDRKMVPVLQLTEAGWKGGHRRLFWGWRTKRTRQAVAKEEECMLPSYYPEQ